MDVLLACSIARNNKNSVWQLYLRRKSEVDSVGKKPNKKANKMFLIGF